MGEFALGEVSRLSKLKKAALVSEAERLVAGTGWMPAYLRAEPGIDASESASKPEQEDTSESAGPRASANGASDVWAAGLA